MTEKPQTSEFQLTTPEGLIHSATVVLVRPAAGGGFQVFLMRRHHRSDFMAGAYVYPGGRLDQADGDPELTGLCRGPASENAAQRLNEPELSNRMALGLHLAAIRETLEEAGILLGAESPDGPNDLFAGRPEDLARHRRRLNDAAGTLLDLARAENLTFDLGVLRPYARWITPAVRKKRFDARFFLALCPDGACPVHDSLEMTDSLWVSPAEALAGRLQLMPPTLKTLEELSDFETMEELREKTEKAEPVPILPQPLAWGDGVCLLLPHDPEYSIMEYKQPPRPGETSRLVLTEGRWEPVQPEA